MGTASSLQRIYTMAIRQPAISREFFPTPSFLLYLATSLVYILT